MDSYDVVHVKQGSYDEHQMKRRIRIRVLAYHSNVFPWSLTWSGSIVSDKMLLLVRNAVLKSIRLPVLSLARLHLLGGNLVLCMRIVFPNQPDCPASSLSGSIESDMARVTAPTNRLSMTKADTKVNRTQKMT